MTAALRLAEPPPAVVELAALSGVPALELWSFLQPRWPAGEAERAAERLQALRDSYCRSAADARRRRARRPQSDVRAIIDHKLAENPRWTKDRAFQWLAGQRQLALGTVRNAYYAPHRHDGVITPSR